MISSKKNTRKCRLGYAIRYTDAFGSGVLIGTVIKESDEYIKILWIGPRGLRPIKSVSRNVFDSLISRGIYKWIF